jgi:hypothetical protein
MAGVIGMLLGGIAGVMTLQMTEAGTVEQCLCGGAACGVGTDVKVVPRKVPDLVLVSANADPGGADAPEGIAPQQNLALKTAGAAFLVSEVKTIAEAIADIHTMFKAVGGPINVVLIDHGSPGVVHVGDEKMGAKPPHLANLNIFVGGVAGKVKDIMLISCSSAAGANGQELVDRLYVDAGMEDVKAYTGDIALRWDPLDPYFTINAYALIGTKKKVGGVTELSETEGTAPAQTASESAGVGKGAIAIAGGAFVVALALGAPGYYGWKRNTR